MLKEIQATGQDGAIDYPELRETLTRLQQVEASAVKPAECTVHEEAPRPAPEEVMAPAKWEDIALSPAPVAEKPARKKAPKAATLQATQRGMGGPSAEPKHGDIAAPQQSVEARTHDKAAETIRVGVNLLDKLMTQVGELVLARNQLLQISNTVEDASLQAVSHRLHLIATELQEEVMKTRMQPIGNIWSQFPRTVRDVALGCGMEVSIDLEGTATELDKTIIEAIKDPLTHLVRNSVDHGIELPEVREKAGKDRIGRLILRAFHEARQANTHTTTTAPALTVNRTP